MPKAKNKTKCLPCLVHGEFTPLSKIIPPLVKKRERQIGRAEGDDRLTDKAWDDFYSALDKHKINHASAEDPTALDIYISGVYDIYISGSDIRRAY